MPELIIKYKSTKALRAIQELSKTLDIVIEMPDAPSKSITDLPITFAQKPEKKTKTNKKKRKKNTLEELRKKAWGDRL